MRQELEEISLSHIHLMLTIALGVLLARRSTDKGLMFARWHKPQHVDSYSVLVDL